MEDIPTDRFRGERAPPENEITKILIMLDELHVKLGISQSEN